MLATKPAPLSSVLRFHMVEESANFCKVRWCTHVHTQTCIPIHTNIQIHTPHTQTHTNVINSF